MKQASNFKPQVASRIRLLIWGLPALILATPLIAMRFSSEVQWTAFDFAMMAVLLGCTAGAIELVVARPWTTRSKIAGIAALTLTMVLIWGTLTTA